MRKAPGKRESFSPGVSSFLLSFPFTREKIQVRTTLCIYGEVLVPGCSARVYQYLLGFSDSSRLASRELWLWLKLAGFEGLRCWSSTLAWGFLFEPSGLKTNKFRWNLLGALCGAAGDRPLAPRFCSSAASRSSGGKKKKKEPKHFLTRLEPCLRSL